MKKTILSTLLATASICSVYATEATPAALENTTSAHAIEKTPREKAQEILDAYKPANASQELAKKSMTDLIDGTPDAKQGILLFGNVGVGKTHLINDPRGKPRGINVGEPSTSCACSMAFLLFQKYLWRALHPSGKPHGFMRV